MLPLGSADLTELTAVRVLAAGGFEEDSATQLAHCSDDLDTPCTALDHERPVSAALQFVLCTPRKCTNPDTTGV